MKKVLLAIACTSVNAFANSSQNDCLLSQWKCTPNVPLNDLCIGKGDTVLRSFDYSNTMGQQIFNAMKELNEQGTCAFPISNKMTCTVSKVGTGIELKVGDQVIGDWLYHETSTQLLTELVNQGVCSK